MLLIALMLGITELTLVATTTKGAGLCLQGQEVEYYLALGRVNLSQVEQEPTTKQIIIRLNDEQIYQTNRLSGIPYISVGMIVNPLLLDLGRAELQFLESRESEEPVQLLAVDLLLDLENGAEKSYQLSGNGGYDYEITFRTFPYPPKEVEPTAEEQIAQAEAAKAAKLEADRKRSVALAEQQATTTNQSARGQSMMFTETDERTMNSPPRTGQGDAQLEGPLPAIDAQERLEFEDRNLIYAPQISENAWMDAVVKVRICVNAAGEVIETSVMQAGTTTTNLDLRLTSINAAQRYRFSPDAEQERQCGTITFTYRQE